MNWPMSYWHHFEKSMYCIGSIAIQVHHVLYPLIPRLSTKTKCLILTIKSTISLQIAGRESPFSTEWIHTISTSIPRLYLRPHRRHGRLWRCRLQIHRPQARCTPYLKSYINLTIHRNSLKVIDKGMILKKWGGGEKVYFARVNQTW